VIDPQIAGHLAVIIVSLFTGITTIMVAWINKRATERNTQKIEEVHTTVNSQREGMEAKIRELNEQIRSLKDRAGDTSSSD
jgi:uncharacterized coiled-coil DUF342 family protein